VRLRCYRAHANTRLQKHANIQEQARALSQKYMGIKSESHMEQVFKAPYIADGTHPVPVTNFLNAQCTSSCSCANCSFV
jgi:saccharopepsin